MFNEKITNLGNPEDDNDATNKKYVDDKVNEIKIPSKVSDLTNDLNFIDEEKLMEERNKLSDIINKKILVDEKQISSLSIQHISRDDYHDLVVNNNINSETLYIVSSDNIDAYGERVTNIANPIESTDATNVEYVNNQFKNLSVSYDNKRIILSQNDEKISEVEINDINTLINVDKKLSNEINMKSSFFIDDEVSDLKKVYITRDEYYDLVANDQTEASVLYIISSDTLNAYNEKITNVLAGENDTDVVNVG
jgi:hypothetical protein